MGLYIEERKDIYNALKDCLDSFEGDVTGEDFKDMAIELYDNYENFSDRAFEE